MVKPHKNRNHGFSYIELLIALTIGAILVMGLSGVVSQALQGYEVVREKSDLIRQARFAMQHMVRAVSHSRRLLLPLNDNPNTNWSEHIREETVPATIPTDDSTKYTAVLAVTLPLYIDLDVDGVADADDDGDGRIDEDLPDDSHHDFTPGIIGIDDDGDGTVDEGSSGDDDEDGTVDEDTLDGTDNDSDGSVDEDPSSDNNSDGCPGICGVDDDDNGSVDNGNTDDDDEDGGELDDPYDPLVFYLNNDSLMERTPVPWNEDGIDTPDGPVDGRDFVESVIAEHVTRFRVERISQAGNQNLMIDLTLELTSPDTGEITSLQTQVRLGGAL